MALTLLTSLLTSFLILASTTAAAAANLTATIRSPSSSPTPAPVPQCPAEVRPWQITNLTLFSAAANQSTYESYLCFHFCDHSPGLELETECVRNIPPSDSNPEGDGDAAISAPGMYFDCDDSSVGFEYNGGGALTVRRSFVDPCVGMPDPVTVFGDGVAEFATETTEMGTWWWDENLEIKVSRLDA